MNNTIKSQITVNLGVVFTPDRVNEANEALKSAKEKVLKFIDHEQELLNIRFPVTDHAPHGSFRKGCCGE